MNSNSSHAWLKVHLSPSLSNATWFYASQSSTTPTREISSSLSLHSQTLRSKIKSQRASRTTCSKPKVRCRELSPISLTVTVLVSLALRTSSASSKTTIKARTLRSTKTSSKFTSSSHLRKLKLSPNRAAR